MFWTDSSFEPKMNFRWYVLLRGKENKPSAFIERNKEINVVPPNVINDKLGANKTVFLANKVSKPTFEIGTKTYNLINRKVQIPGNVTWKDVNITLIDTVENSLTDFLKEYFFYANARYDKSNITGIANLETVSKEHLSNLEFQIYQIDSEGNQVEKWTLVNPMIVDIETSELNYSNDDLSEYTLKIIYDWAYEGEEDLLSKVKSKKETSELEKQASKTKPVNVTPQSQNRIRS